MSKQTLHILGPENKVIAPFDEEFKAKSNTVVQSSSQLFFKKWRGDRDKTFSFKGLHFIVINS